MHLASHRFYAEHDTCGEKRASLPLVLEHKNLQERSVSLPGVLDCAPQPILIGGAIIGPDGPMSPGEELREYQKQPRWFQLASGQDDASSERDEPNNLRFSARDVEHPRWFQLASDREDELERDEPSSLRFSASDVEGANEAHAQSAHMPGAEVNERMSELVSVSSTSLVSDTSSNTVAILPSISDVFVRATAAVDASVEEVPLDKPYPTARISLSLLPPLSNAAEAAGGVSLEREAAAHSSMLAPRACAQVSQARSLSSAGCQSTPSASIASRRSGGHSLDPCQEASLAAVAAVSQRTSPRRIRRRRARSLASASSTSAMRDVAVAPARALSAPPPMTLFAQATGDVTHCQRTCRLPPHLAESPPQKHRAIRPALSLSRSRASLSVAVTVQCGERGARSTSLESSNACASAGAAGGENSDTTALCHVPPDTGEQSERDMSGHLGGDDSLVRHLPMRHRTAVAGGEAVMGVEAGAAMLRGAMLQRSESAEHNMQVGETEERGGGGELGGSGGEYAGADYAMLQQVVKQLESDDAQLAEAAGAALEYLVSSSEYVVTSSDPKRDEPGRGHNGRQVRPQGEEGGEAKGKEGGLLTLVMLSWKWSAEGSKANRRALGSIVGLWGNLLGLLTTSKASTSDTKAQVCGAMSKLGFRNSKNILEMVRYPKMLAALTDLLDMKTHPAAVVVQAWRVLQNFVSGMDEIKVLLCSNGSLLDRIKEACCAAGVSSEVRMRAVSVIMHASSSDDSRLLLVKARIAEEALEPVVSGAIRTEKEEATRIRATLASANLCGREERSMFLAAPEMLRAISNTIAHALKGTHFCNIKWSLSGVMLPLFNLSCSDSNKRVLSHCGTVSLLLQAVRQCAKVLRRQVEEESECAEEEAKRRRLRAQEDVQGDWSLETLELMLRTLANFTFDLDAREQMLEEDALAILQAVLESLRGHESSLDTLHQQQQQQQQAQGALILDAATTQYQGWGDAGDADQAICPPSDQARCEGWHEAMCPPPPRGITEKQASSGTCKQVFVRESAILIVEDIIYLLSEKNENVLAADCSAIAAVPIEASAAHGSACMHIMISYSWAVAKHFVVEVSSGLRKKGYDVWRDEDGSQLVRKMMGSSMEIMAQAIECADVVIIFVSRAYRDSYNCKLEGKYAQVRERAGLTKILFVMMEEDYTPESSAGVDGWLGMLIGDHIYYPGWDKEKLEDTVDQLAKAVNKLRNDSSSSSTHTGTNLQKKCVPPERASGSDDDSVHLLPPPALRSGRSSRRPSLVMQACVPHEDTLLSHISDPHTWHTQHSLASLPSRRSVSPCPKGRHVKRHADTSAAPLAPDQQLIGVGARVCLGPSGSDEPPASRTSRWTILGDHVGQVGGWRRQGMGGSGRGTGCASARTHGHNGEPTQGGGGAVMDTLEPPLGAGAHRGEQRRAQHDEPCETVDDFLDVYGLWEIGDKLTHHRVDDMEVMVHLRPAHVARITDRVGIQVRLEAAITRERRLNGLTVTASSLEQLEPGCMGGKARQGLESPATPAATPALPASTHGLEQFVSPD